MATNRDRAKNAIESAEREFRNAARSLKDEDYAGTLKYLQECTEYATKAVLMAYGVDYPKIHEVGRFLYDLIEKCPKWFVKQMESISDVTDDLARGRPKFKYPYEHQPEEYGAMAKEILPKVSKALESCHRLIGELFR